MINESERDSYRCLVLAAELHLGTVRKDRILMAGAGRSMGAL